MESEPVKSPHPGGCYVYSKQTNREYDPPPHQACRGKLEDKEIFNLVPRLFPEKSFVFN
jgi:hypothetical protein